MNENRDASGDAKKNWSMLEDKWNAVPCGADMGVKANNNFWKEALKGMDKVRVFTWVEKTCFVYNGYRTPKAGFYLEYVIPSEKAREMLPLDREPGEMWDARKILKQWALTDLKM